MGKTCNNCAEKLEKTCKTEENSNVIVPYVVHEATVARQERHIKRLWIALIVAISMLFASFGLFVWYESQFETIDYSYDYSQDGEGTNIIGNNNEVDNGAKAEDKSES
jgi:hypothetical protein